MFNLSVPFEHHGVSRLDLAERTKACLLLGQKNQVPALTLPVKS